MDWNNFLAIFWNKNVFIPTPALGKDGLKLISWYRIGFCVSDSNARFGQRWIETQIKVKLSENNPIIPTPALGKDGLKLLLFFSLKLPDSRIPTPALGKDGLKHEKLKREMEFSLHIPTPALGKDGLKHIRV